MRIKKLLSFILLIFFLKSNLFAQWVSPVIQKSARSVAMGNVGLGFKDIHSAFSNAAALAYLDNFSAVISTEKRYFLPNLTFFSTAIAKNTTFGTVGLMTNFTGFDAYQEQKVGLNFARLLSQKLSIGVQFNYFRFAIPESGTANNLSFEIGTHYQFNRKIALAAKIANPIQSNSNYKIPSSCEFGLCYKPSDKVLIMSEVEYNISQKVNIKTGLEYSFRKQLFIRTGFESRNNQLGFGLGFQFKKHLKLDISSTIHPTLGVSPSVGLVWE